MKKIRLPSVFKHDKVAPEIDEEPEEERDEESSEKEEEISQKDESGRRGMESEKLYTDVEKVKAQIEALNSEKEAWSGKFSEISEKLGELRSSIADNDSKLAGLEANVSKALDIMDHLKPEQLLGELERKDAQFEALKAKLDATQAVYDSLIEEVKDVRAKIGMIRGVDALLKLNDEIRDELISIQKIKAVVEAHADKVEQIFLDLKESSKSYASFSLSVKDMESAIAEMKTLTTAHEIKMKSFADRNESAVVAAKVESLSGKMSELAEREGRNSADNARISDALQGGRDAIEKLGRNQLLIEDKIKRLASDREVDPIEHMKSIVNKNSERMQEILDIVELLTDKVMKKHKKKVKKIKSNIEADRKYFNVYKSFVDRAEQEAPLEPPKPAKEVKRRRNYRKKPAEKDDNGA